MSLAATVFVSLALLAITALFALVYAIKHAEEGYEDDTGYHPKNPDAVPAPATQSNVDTGNPWDQVEGSSCPWHFNRTLEPDSLTAHRP